MTLPTRSHRISLLLLWVLVAACSKGGETGVTPITQADSAGVVIVSNDMRLLGSRCDVAAAPRLIIGEAEGEEVYQLYRVFGATVLSDGRIALVNQGSQELRIYAPDGQFLSASGREGDGPGEFRNAFLLWRLPGDTIWIGDYRPWAFEVFGPSGEWVRQVTPSPQYSNPPRELALLSDGRFIIGEQDRSRRAPTFELDYLHILLHGSDGGLIDTLQVMPHGRWGQTSDNPRSLWLYPWFESFAEFTGRGDRFVLGHGSEAELRVYALDPDPRLERIIRWSGLERAVRNSDVEAARQEVMDRYVDLDANRREALVAPRVHEDRPVAAVIPAFVSVQIGVDGAIWVEEYSMPGESPVSDWIRFDEDGLFSCRVIIPENFEVYEFGSDYILGKRQDALGIETIALYEFSPTSER